MSRERGILTAREVAGRLNIEPKQLRAILRRMGKGAGAKGKRRYEFHWTDIPELAAIIKSAIGG